VIVVVPENREVARAMAAAALAVVTE